MNGKVQDLQILQCSRYLQGARKGPHMTQGKACLIRSTFHGQLLDVGEAALREEVHECGHGSASTYSQALEALVPLQQALQRLDAMLGAALHPQRGERSTMVLSHGAGDEAEAKAVLSIGRHGRDDGLQGAGQGLERGQCHPERGRGRGRGRGVGCVGHGECGGEVEACACAGRGRALLTACVEEGRR